MASTVLHLNVLAFGKKIKKTQHPRCCGWKIAFLLVEMNWLIKGLSSNLDSIASIAETIAAAQHILFYFSFKKERIFTRRVFKFGRSGKKFWTMIFIDSDCQCLAKLLLSTYGILLLRPMKFLNRNNCGFWNCMEQIPHSEVWFFLEKAEGQVYFHYCGISLCKPQENGETQKINVRNIIY